MQFLPDRLLIFSKAAVPGQVKTRLMPELDAVAAARIQDRLLQRQWAQARRLQGVDVWLECAPNAEHWYFQAYRPRISQIGESLGERMFLSFQRALAKTERVVLIGSDCPGLNAEYLAEAFRLLHEVEAVLGPVEDGGYALIGLNRISEEAFTGIEWSSDKVLQQTLRNFERLGWRYRCLPRLWDVDRPADLERLRAQYPAIVSE